LKVQNLTCDYLYKIEVKYETCRDKSKAGNFYKTKTINRVNRHTKQYGKKQKQSK